MSTITKEFTKEQLIEKLQRRVAVTANYPDVEEAQLDAAIFKIALASLEAEPVCVIDQSNLDYLNAGSDADVWPVSRTEMGDVLLYRTAPPAPVSVPAAMEMDDDFDSAFEHGKAVGWNAFRAAMLQGAEPVTTAYKLRDAVEIIRNSGIEIDSGKIQAERDSLNSPVIPDGWVACSERMPDEAGDIIVVSDGIVMSGVSYSRKKGFYLQALEYDADEPVDDVTHWMTLPAAPQQE